MARRRDPELCERWAERIQRQKSSGLTIARFCEHEAVSQVSFHAWKRRLAGQSTPTTPPSSTPSPAFLPVRWSEPNTTTTTTATAAAAGRVEFELPNGVHMRILDAHAEFVGRVAQLVGAVDLPRRGDAC